jgi:hypothetical protein
LQSSKNRPQLQPQRNARTLTRTSP